jgi:hypothetical protein
MLTTKTLSVIICILASAVVVKAASFYGVGLPTDEYMANLAAANGAP